VVAGVRLFDRLPNDLLTVNGIAVYYGGDFPVGGAQVEADTATLKVASQGLGGLVFRGNGFRRTGKNGEGFLVHVGAHELAVKVTGTAFTVALPEILGDGNGAAHVNGACAALPEQEFHQAFRIEQVGAGLGMAVGKHHSFIAGNGTVAAFEAKNQGNALFRIAHRRTKGAVGQGGGAKIGVKRGNDCGRDKHPGHAHGDVRFLSFRV